MVQLHKWFNHTKCIISLSGSIEQAAQSSLSGLTI